MELTFTSQDLDILWTGVTAAMGAGRQITEVVGTSGI